MYNRKRILGGMALLLSLWLLFVLAISSSGVAMAATVTPELGGFTVEADEIIVQEANASRGEPALVGTEAETATAQLELEQATIKGLVMTKTVDVSTLPGVTGQMKIVLATPDADTVDSNTFREVEPVQLEGAFMRASTIEADLAIARTMVVGEHPSDDPEAAFNVSFGGNPRAPDVRAHYQDDPQELNIRTEDEYGDDATEPVLNINSAGELSDGDEPAPGLELYNAEIDAYDLSASSIDIGDLTASVEYEPGA